MKLRSLVVLLALLAVGACAVEPAPTGGPGELNLGPPRVVIDEASGLLALPVGVEIDTDGNIYVLDRQDLRVVVVNGSGKLVHAFGGPGQGPGEFTRPQFFGITDDDIRVLDVIRRNVQQFSFDGVPSGTYSVDSTGTTFAIAAAFAADGRVAYSTIAGEDGLVVLLGPEGGEPELFGELVAEGTQLSGTFITEEVHQGLIPDFMRNHALPMFTPGGELWLFLQTEAELRRYSAEGAVLHAVTLDVPESDAIRAEFFDWYAEWDEGVLRHLQLVVDGFATDDRVWLLWLTPPGDDGLITVHNGTGAILWRLVFPTPSIAPSENSDSLPYVSRRFFAVDETRRLVYVADTDTSSLRAFDIPLKVFE